MFKYLLIFSLAGCTSLPKEEVKPTLPPKEIVCKGTIMEGWEAPKDMSPIDIINYQTAKKQCRIRFRKSPCLVRFKLIGHQSYRATCGHSK